MHNQLIMRNLAFGEGAFDWIVWIWLLQIYNRELHIWELQNWSTSSWVSKHYNPPQALFSDLLDDSRPSERFTREACFPPDKDAIFLWEWAKVNEFDGGGKKAIGLENVNWSHRLLPLSRCLVNLFDVNQDMEEANAKKELGIEVR